MLYLICIMLYLICILVPYKGGVVYKSIFSDFPWDIGLRQEENLSNLRQHQCLPPVFGWVRVSHLFGFLWFLFCLVYPMLSVSPIVSSFFLFFYLEESRAVHICWSSSIENKSFFESMLSTLSRTIPNWYLQIVQEYSLQMVYNFRHLPIRKSCNYFHPTLVIFFGVRHVSVFIFVTFSLRNILLVVWYYVTNIE